MKKEIKSIDLKEYYLLGIDRYGIKYWLQETIYEDDWYWDIVYIENNFSGATCCVNFKNLIAPYSINAWNDMFDKTPLSESEIKTLYELIETVYILCKTKEVYNKGFIKFIDNPCKELLKNQDKVNEINDILLPEIFKEIRKLFE